MKMVHVTIQTKHFEEEIKFYQEIVGLAIQSQMEGPKKIAFLADSADETKVEIIDNPEADNSGNPNISMGFKSEDVEKKREELIALGYEVSPMISPVPAVKFFFTKDPAGVTVQFI